MKEMRERKELSVFFDVVVAAKLNVVQSCLYEWWVLVMMRGNRILQEYYNPSVHDIKDRHCSVFELLLMRYFFYVVFFSQLRS